MTKVLKSMGMLPLLFTLMTPGVTGNAPEPGHTAYDAGTVRTAPYTAVSAAAQASEPVLREEVEAVYVGLADSHTAEVNVKGEPVALQFGEALAPVLDELQEGDAVVITFTEEKLPNDPVAVLRTLLEIEKTDH